MQGSEFVFQETTGDQGVDVEKNLTGAWMRFRPLFAGERRRVWTSAAGRKASNRIEDGARLFSADFAGHRYHAATFEAGIERHHRDDAPVCCGCD
jgi:hypothetical protein